MSEDFIIQDLENAEPSPISPRECECGCGNHFQPKRSSQIFISKKHADYYYHHQVRKPKQANQVEIEKIHRLNDRICDRHFHSSNSMEVICHWDTLLAEGFNDQYMQGSDEIDGVNYIFTYNYMISLYKKDDGIIKVKISKR